MPEFPPEIAAWVARVQELRERGEAITLFELHEPCLGVIVPPGYAARPGLRVCTCRGVEAHYDDARGLLEAHGLGVLIPYIHSAPGTRTRYDR